MASRQLKAEAKPQGGGDFMNQGVCLCVCMSGGQLQPLFIWCPVRLCPGLLVSWCATSRPKKSEPMIHKHTCLSLRLWQGKTGWTHKQILFNVYNEPAGGKGQGIYRPFFLQKQRQKNKLIGEQETFPVPLLQSCRKSPREIEKGKKEFSTGNLVLGTDYPTSKTLPLLPCLFSFITEAI